jgi:hypothetical protein
MKKIVLLFLCIVLNSLIRSSAREIQDFSKVVIGRKELIQNDLVETVLSNQSNLCQSFVNSVNWTNRNCEKSIELLYRENDQLEKQLKECKASLSQKKK